jgi:hypothetical protein
MAQAGRYLRRWSAEGCGGYTFFCPGCVRPHTLVTEGSAAWGFNGNLDRPTFTPSVLVTRQANPAALEEFKEYRTELRCHSFVTDGQIQFLSDCTHTLKGQTVPLPELPGHLRDDHLC